MPSGVRGNTAEINSDGSFCMMFPPLGCQSVQSGAGAATPYCFEGANTSRYEYSEIPIFSPPDSILSANYAEDLTKNYRQITGCMDDSKWGLNPTDVGGQIDSVGWPYTCLNAKKFISFLEPKTNIYCIRCCYGTNADIDCDTTHPIQGCSNAIPGDYRMKDNSTCKPPVITTYTGTSTAYIPYPVPTLKSPPESSSNSRVVLTGIAVSVSLIILVIGIVYGYQKWVNEEHTPVASPRLPSYHGKDTETVDGDEQLPEYRP
ncbi:hypothetical protein BGZ80_004095 [Entomortierella chlamydospora]|uniref:Uncharacterized protein n=1 Tax=Entomortierella chlamydospora TaxID=101097 RepID=A0A9P6MMX5_9FUNG|nr:hypothetical protein BGZ79_003110 [Entomortierella chlamydospora]KAG0007901.1 hypothetical protein BGZ80_004095 [Entomortierella chlamydospora]